MLTLSADLRDHRHCISKAPKTKAARISNRLELRQAPPNIANAPTNRKWNPSLVSLCFRFVSL
jgi:hypothetical protein